MRKGPNYADHLSNGITVVWLERKNGDRLPCFIDTVDYPLAKNHRWHASRQHRTFYARTANKEFFLHSLLFPEAEKVDHIDYDGLNNRRKNLRPATNQQNLQNQRKAEAREGRHFTSHYKGVSFHKKTSKFASAICINGKNIHLGLFGSEEDAARAYNEAASKHFGQFAALNEIAADSPDIPDVFLGGVCVNGPQRGGRP